MLRHKHANATNQIYFGFGANIENNIWFEMVHVAKDETN